MTTAQERRLHYDPATDTEIANYRALITSLITRIDQAEERAERAESTLTAADQELAERLIAAEAQVAALTHAAEQQRTLHDAMWTQIYALLGWPAEASVSAAQVVARIKELEERK